MHDSQWDERSIRFGRWKLIARLFESNPDVRADELYDLESDPAETRNLLHQSSAPAEAGQMAQRLAQWATATHDTVAAKLATRIAVSF
jgi:arylsulfatase A-like enzyme